MVSVELIGPYVSSTTEIERWLEQLDEAVLAHYGDVSPARKKACIITFIGEEGRDVINNLPANRKTTYELLRTALIGHYKDSINVTVERHKFNQLAQQQDEPIELFVTKLRTQAAKCKFVAKHVYQVTDQNNQQVQRDVQTDMSDQFIRDRLVCGVFHQGTRTKLLRERDLTLQSAIEIVKAVETANSHVKKLFQPSQTSELSVDRIQKRKHKPQIRRYDSGKSKTPCIRCGRGPHQEAQCPALNVECHACKTVGHYERMCRSSKKVHQIDEECDGASSYSADTGDQVYMGVITQHPQCNKNLSEIAVNCIDWVEYAVLNDVSIQFKVDTGAQANVLPLSLINKICKGNKKLLSKTQVKLSGYGGANIPVVGEIVLDCKFKGIPYYRKLILPEITKGHHFRSGGLIFR